MNPTVEQTYKALLSHEQLTEIQCMVNDVHCSDARLANRVPYLLAHAAALQAQLDAEQEDRRHEYRIMSGAVEEANRNRNSAVALLEDTRARLAEVEQERREGLSLDKVAAVAVEAFRRQAIEAVRAKSQIAHQQGDSTYEYHVVVTLLETLGAERREGNG